jgi:hypothetical protein
MRKAQLIQLNETRFPIAPNKTYLPPPSEWT